MHLNKCWTNPSQASEEIKCISKCVDKTHPCQRVHIMHHNMCWTDPSYTSKDTKCLLTCVEREQTARIKNSFHHLLIKPLTCHRGHKIYLNMRLPNPSNASEDTICNSTCVDLPHPMPVRTQNISQLVLTKIIPVQRGDIMHLSMCWQTSMPARTQNTSQYVLTKTSHASDDRSYIFACVYQTHPMPTRTQNVSQQVLTKLITCQRRHKMYPNMCWLNPSNYSDDKRCISTYVDETNSMIAKKWYVSQILLTTSHLCQREQMMFLI